MRKNIFIAFTPYHIFLASMIALTRFENSNILIVIKDFSADKIIRALNSSKIFAEVITLPGLYKQEFQRNTLRKNNAKSIGALINKYNSIDTLFLGTDTRIETQSAAYKVKKIFKNAVVAVLEDGGDFYKSNAMEVPSKGFWRTLHSKLVFGDWYEYVKIGGLYSITEEVYAIFPQLVRDEIRIKKILPIECEVCIQNEYQKFIENYWNIFWGEKEKLQKVDGILMIAYSEYTNHYPRYKELIREICKKAAQKGMRIGIKYHPREEIKDYCNLGAMKNIYFLEEEISAENIYALQTIKLKFIIGDVSSALMTAKWILKDNINVYSVAPILNMADSKFLMVLEQIKIKLVKDIYSIDF